MFAYNVPLMQNLQKTWLRVQLWIKSSQEPVGFDRLWRGKFDLRQIVRFFGVNSTDVLREKAENLTKFGFSAVDQRYFRQAPGYCLIVIINLTILPLKIIR